MSCCGQARDPNENNNRAVAPTQIINQQPGPLPALEKPYFQTPSVSPPPAVHPSPYGQNGSFAQQPSWTSHSPSPPPMNQFGTPPPGSPPPTTSFSLNGRIGDSIIRPSSSFQAGHGMGGNLTSSLSGSFTTPQIKTEGSNFGADEGRMSISIDFGTTFSGVAYGSSRISGGQVQQILTWPGSVETYRKIPTCLLYDEGGQILAWGLEAKHTALANTYRCEWFKLFLEPRALRDESAVDPRLPQLPVSSKQLWK
jgi:hypothetical protein